MMFGMGPMRDGKRPIRDSEMELVHMLPEENKSRQLGYDRFKLMTFQGYDQTAGHFEKWYQGPAPTMHRMGVSAPLVWRAILSGKPYPVTAMINWESNPLLWAGNTKLVHQAMTSPNLELFVVNEMWMTPTALLADYVLPIASWMERPHIDTIEDLTDIYVGGEQAIEPLGERKEDYYFWRELGIRCGQAEYWPWKNTDEQMEYRLKPAGIPKEELIQKGILLPEPEEKKYEQKGFATPSGKFELSSSILKNLGYDPWPFYEEPAESPVRTPEV